MIVFFTGPSGGGKTTLARAWAQSRERPTALIDADTVTGFVRHGSQAAVSAASTLEEVIEQYRITREVYSAMAATYAANGLDCAIAQLYGKPPPDSPWFGDSSCVDALNPIFIVLYPPWETCRERVIGRGSSVDEARGNYAFDWKIWEQDPRATMLDTTGMTVEESVAAVNAILATVVDRAT